MNRMPDLTPYPPSFARAAYWIFPAEGHLSDDPDDPGGITKFGISLRFLRTLGELGDIDGDGDVDADDIRALTPEHAARIYHERFWLAARCERLHPTLALAHFDAAVNTGLHRAAKLLQQTLRVRVDGIVGPMTIGAANQAGPDALPELLGYRSQFYHDLVTGKSSLAKYYRGWVNRLFRLQAFIHGDAAWNR